MEKISKKYYDTDGQFEWNPELASDEDSSSSTSDFSESDGGSEENEEENSEVWQDDDADIPQGELEGDQGVGKRLALNKMDWDVLRAVDILALFRGLCTGEQTITKVIIYPSLFGIE